jgi:hypothetical protein
VGRSGPSVLYIKDAWCLKVKRGPDLCLLLASVNINLVWKVAVTQQSVIVVPFSVYLIHVQIIRQRLCSSGNWWWHLLQTVTRFFWNESPYSSMPLKYNSHAAITMFPTQNVTVLPPLQCCTVQSAYCLYRLDHVFWILLMTRLHSGYDGFYHRTFRASLYLTGGRDMSNTTLRADVFCSVVVRLFSVSSVIIAFFEGLFLTWSLRRKPWLTWGCCALGGKNCIFRLHLSDFIIISQRVVVYFPGV